MQLKGRSACSIYCMQGALICACNFPCLLAIARCFVPTARLYVLPGRIRCPQLRCLNFLNKSSHQPRNTVFGHIVQHANITRTLVWGVVEVLLHIHCVNYTHFGYLSLNGDCLVLYIFQANMCSPKRLSEASSSLQLLCKHLIFPDITVCD